MKYKPSRDLPNFARELQTLSPSKLAYHILSKRNKEITPQAVINWFRRHPKIYAQLSNEIIEGLPTEKEAVSKAIFERKAFEELPSVKDWIMFMRTRRIKGKPLHPEYVKQQIGLLKRGLETHSVLKHPDRLTFRDAQEIFMELEEKGKDTYPYRRAFKDFLKSKGAEKWQLIGVGKPRGFGKYKDLFVERPIIHEMLDWIKTQDFEVYVADNLMFHNGIRISAVLGAEIEDFKMQPDGWAKLTVLEKFRTELTFDLIPQVAREIELVIGDRKSGKIFKDVTERRINILNRKALKKFVPDLEPKIVMPSHFFRHMCAQHLKKLVGSVQASAIMKTTLQSFQESYGGDTEEDVEKWTRKTLPKLDPEVEEEEDELKDNMLDMDSEGY